MDSQPINFIASIEDNEIKNIQEIAEGLRKKGCKINHILSFAGVITGQTSGKEDSLDEIKIKGIKNIEEDGEVRAF